MLDGKVLRSRMTFGDGKKLVRHGDTVVEVTSETDQMIVGTTFNFRQTQFAKSNDVKPASANDRSDFYHMRAEFIPRQSAVHTEEKLKAYVKNQKELMSKHHFKLYIEHLTKLLQDFDYKS